MRYGQEYTREIAMKIKRLCANNNISVNQTLLKCGINTSFITDLNKGKMPSVDKIVYIADFFNVSTDYLLKGKENDIANEKENEKMDKQKIDKMFNMFMEQSLDYEQLVENIVTLTLKNAMLRKSLDKLEEKMKSSKEILVQWSEGEFNVAPSFDEFIAISKHITNDMTMRDFICFIERFFEYLYNVPSLDEKENLLLSEYSKLNDKRKSMILAYIYTQQDTMREELASEASLNKDKSIS